MLSPQLASPVQLNGLPATHHRLAMSQVTAVDESCICAGRMRAGDSTTCGAMADNGHTYSRPCHGHAEHYIVFAGMKQNGVIDGEFRTSGFISLYCHTSAHYSIRKIFHCILRRERFTAIAIMPRGITKKVMLMIDGVSLFIIMPRPIAHCIDFATASSRREAV